jgi:hypothetical protein
MDMRIRLAALAPLILPVSLAIGIYEIQSQESDGPPSATVCEVVTNPRRFDFRHVRIRAQVWSDGLEHTVLVNEDDSCKRGMGLELSRLKPNDTGDSALGQALYGEPPSGAGPGTKKRVFATFVGIYRTDPHRELQVESISDVIVKWGKEEMPIKD